MNDVKDDGGGAFPLAMTWQESIQQPGMSLRDHFASQALAMFALQPSQDRFPQPEIVATYAYLIADAMLQARK